MDHRHESPTNLSPMAMDQQAAAVSDIAKVKTMTAANSSSSSNDHDVISSTNGSNRREFACKFCEKKFHTKQALGGHQNAHKAQRSQQHVVGSMMTSLIFNNSSRPNFHAHPNNQLGYSYYQPRQPYALIHNLAAVNRPPRGLFAFNNNNAAAAINNNNHRPVLGFSNVPARFVGSNFYTLVPPPPSLMLPRVPPASNYVRFPNMNPFPAAGYVNNLAAHAVEEEEADDETGLDLSLKLGYSNRG